MLLVLKRVPWLRFDFLAKKLEKILLFIIVLFFFFIFPILLLHISLTAYFNARVTDLRQTSIDFLDKELSKINEYSNNRIYYHNLFSKVSEYAQINDNPEQYLQANFANLKNNYPGEFSFITWNRDGKIIGYLTDWPGYSYAFEKLYIILKEITQLSISNRELNIEELDIVKNNIKILKSVFGNIFLGKNLKYPLKNSVDAGPFLVDSSGTLSHAWYSIGEKISFVVFISKSLIADKSGLRKIIENTNATSKKCITGFFETTDFDTPKTDFPEENLGSLKLAVARFESLGESLYEDDRVLIKFCAIEPSVRTFACFCKTDLYWKTEQNISFWMLIGVGILLAFYAVCIHRFIINKVFLSLKWKIITLIIFVNIVPVIVVSSITYELLHEKISDLRNGLFKSVTSELRNIDARCDDYLIGLEKEIHKNYELNFYEKDTSKEKFKAFIDSVSKSIKTNAIVVASNSDVIYFCTVDKEFDKSTFKALCNSLLSFSNNLPYSNESFLGDVFKPEKCEFVRNVNVNKRKLIPLNFDFLTFSGMCYFDFIKDKTNKNYDYCVFLLWNAYEFNKAIITEHYKALKANSRLDYLSFRHKLNNYFLGDAECNVDNLKRYDNENKKITCEWIDKIKNKSCLFVGINSSGFSKWDIIGASSEEGINRETLCYILLIIAAIIVSFMLCLAFAYIIFINFLCPIEDLNTGLLEIKKGNFDYRLDNAGEDEFDYLKKILNRIIENFGELKIAQNFQLALAPKNNIDSNNLRIYSKTQIMTTLGGDYFDTFAINDEFSAILIGDVAGHGVAAGLIMAMAKAGVLTADEETKLNPALMLEHLNNILLSIKCKSLKRMMTMQYFVVNVKNGSVTYSNAGHCFPLLFDKASSIVREIDSISMPLGIKKNLSFKNNEFKLNNNETLILYTDGCFEFTEKNNEKFKYEKLSELLNYSYNDDAEVFYRNLNDCIAERRLGEQEDDITIAIVNWREK